MTKKRIEKIAKLAGTTYAKAYELIFADWPDDHQYWLETASDEAIAEWIRTIL